MTFSENLFGLTQHDVMIIGIFSSIIRNRGLTVGPESKVQIWLVAPQAAFDTLSAIGYRKRGMQFSAQRVCANRANTANQVSV
jgi:hypothetical protein